MEQALLCNNKTFPPMLPRVLRVTRAKILRGGKEGKETYGRQREKAVIYSPKKTSKSQSFAGRASRLLGRAGASNLRATRRRGNVPTQRVFESYRAARGPTKKQGKPQNRSSRRGAEFKAKSRKSQ